WDERRVAAWLAEIGFESYQAAFIENKITGEVLRELNYTYLRDIGVKIVGDRARILQAIK
ncbi:sterile alpha motif/pointed domain-containing protein, partial [Entophlyctis helioformis]